MSSPDNLANKKMRKGLLVKRCFLDHLKNQPLCTRHTSPVADIFVDYPEPPYITSGQEKTLKIRVENHMLSQQWLNVKTYKPEGFVIYPADNFCFSLEQYHGNVGYREIDMKIKAPEILTERKIELLLDVSFNGRHTRIFVPIQFLNSPIPESDIL